jgi:stress-induced-phosphoprotein 1
VKAEEHRQKGNELFKKGIFPEALKEYDEGLRRDPDAVTLYSNRSATYIKLGEFLIALKDADKCLEMDPNFIKAYSRKGTCHHFLKEYHKAL